MMMPCWKRRTVKRMEKKKILKEKIPKEKMPERIAKTKAKVERA